MKIHLLAITISALLLLLGGAAYSEEPLPAPRYSIMQDAPPTGSAIRRKRLESDLPLNKRWDELTAAQQRSFRDLYDAMKDSDEPPYPMNGLEPLYKGIAKAHDILRKSGTLDLEVRVSAAGDAMSVAIFKSPTPEVAKAAAGMLMLQKYKPAKCGGQPCAMSFPLRMELTQEP